MVCGPEKILILHPKLTDTKSCIYESINGQNLFSLYRSMAYQTGEKRVVINLTAEAEILTLRRSTVDTF